MCPHADNAAVFSDIKAITERKVLARQGPQWQLLEVEQVRPGLGVLSGWARPLHCRQSMVLIVVAAVDELRPACH